VRRWSDAASRLIASGLWLADSSALLATALYFLEAPYVRDRLPGVRVRVCGVSVSRCNYRRRQHPVGLAHC